jgi:CheY-like chemotaxis protein
MIIDDEVYNVEMIVSEMKDRGIDYVAVFDGKDAFSMIEKEKPAVIVSDYKMPGLDGIELLRFLRNINYTAPVIWMTGNADDEIKKEAWKLGVYNIHNKPFDPELVAQDIANALEIEADYWLTNKPKFLTEKLLEKHFQKLNIELENELYQKVKTHCIENHLSLNTFISNLLNNALK